MTRVVFWGGPLDGAERDVNSHNYKVPIPLPVLPFTLEQAPSDTLPEMSYHLYEVYSSPDRQPVMRYRGVQSW